MKYTKGITLIELMIVVAILGIISAIAVPGYSAYVHTANRADAYIALEKLAAAQARYNLNVGNGAYASSIAALGASTSSDKGYYTLAVTSGTVTGFSITATAVSSGPQANDETACQTLVIDQSLKKTPIACW